MIKITLKMYNSIHRDYRGIWTREDEPHLVGRRSAFLGSIHALIGKGWGKGNNGTDMLFEGIHFEIVEEGKEDKKDAK